MYDIHTDRLVLRPVSWEDMADMIQLKSDSSVFGQMLGGVRSPLQVALDMQSDIACWGQFSVGMFVVLFDGCFAGVTGIHDRPDGRGLALRFAFLSWARGQGVALESASIALSFAHNKGIKRIIGVARQSNIASISILMRIGMKLCESFRREGVPIVVYESTVI